MLFVRSTELHDTVSVEPNGRAALSTPFRDRAIRTRPPAPVLADETNAFDDLGSEGRWVGVWVESRGAGRTIKNGSEAETQPCNVEVVAVVALVHVVRVMIVW